MRKSDVELVISARTDAEKNVKSLREELAKLRKDGANTGDLDIQVEALNKSLAESEARLEKLSRAPAGTRTKQDLAEIANLNKELIKLRDQLNKKNEQIAKRQEIVQQREIKLAGQLIGAIEAEKIARANAATAGVNPDLRQRFEAFRKERLELEAQRETQRKIDDIVDTANKKRQEQLALEKQITQQTQQRERSVAAVPQAVSSGNPIKQRQELAALSQEYEKAGGNAREFQKIVDTAISSTDIARGSAYRDELSKLAVKFRDSGGDLRDWKAILTSTRGEILATTVALRKLQEVPAQRRIQIEAAVPQAVSSGNPIKQRQELAALSQEYEKAGGNAREFQKIVSLTISGTDLARGSAYRLEIAKLATKFREAGGSLSQWREQMAKTRGEILQTTVAVRKFAEAQDSAALTRANSNSRKTLSVMQRIQAQVLATTAAYVGLYGVIDGVNSVFQTQNKLIAAQNRLEIGFGGDVQKAGADLLYVQGAARSLGLEIEGAIDQYSKLVVASTGLGFSQNELRGIFEGVSSAILVNKLSVDDANGVFRAFEQIMSKNRVTAEELRLQLGDRLPGAVGFFATAIGKTGPELDALLRSGSLGAEELIKFAKVLETEFGGKVTASLESPQAKVVAFKNALFDLRIGLIESGFIDILINQLEEFTKQISDPAIQASLVDLAVFIAKIGDVILIVIKNLDKVILALETFAVLKGLQFAGGLLSGIDSAAGAFLGLSKSISKAGGGIAGIIAAARNASPALLLLLNPVTLLVAGLGALAFGAVALQKSTEKTTSALDTWESENQDLLKSLGKVEKHVSDVTNEVKALEEATKSPFDIKIEVNQQKFKEVQEIISEIETRLSNLSNKKGTGQRAEKQRVSEIKRLEKELSRANETKNAIQNRNDILESEKAAATLSAEIEKNRVRVGRLSKDSEKLYEDALKNATSRFDELEKLETKSLDDKLAILKRKGDEEKVLIAGQINERIDLIKQRNARIAQLEEQSGVAPESLTTLIEEVQINGDGAVKDDSVYIKAKGEIKSIIDLKKEQVVLEQEIADLQAITPSIDKVQAFDRAKEIRDFYLDAANDIGTAFNDAVALGESPSIDEAVAKFADIKAKLNEELTKVDGPVAESMAATLRTISIAERQFLANQLNEALSAADASFNSAVDQSLDVQIQKIRTRFAEIKDEFSGSLTPEQTDIVNVAENDAVKATALRELSEAQTSYNAALEQAQLMETLGIGVRSESIAKIGEQRETLLALVNDILAQSEAGLINIDPAQIANLRTLQIELGAAGNGIKIFAAKAKTAFTDGLGTALFEVASGAKSAKQAFADMANSFLAFIGKILAQWAALNAVSLATGGGTVPLDKVFSASVAHGGGVAGSALRTREMPSWVYNTAPRYHEGGVAGLAPDEVPAVLRKGEEVLTQNDPRHRMNGGLGGSSAQNIQVINYVDSGSVASQGNATPEGTKSILNVVKANKAAFQQILA